MPVSSKLLTDFGYKEEFIELGRDNAGHTIWGKTGFPKPAKLRRVVLEDVNQSIEESYYWLLDETRESQGYRDVTKITDVSAAGEASSFFGSTWQRIGLQQDKVSQFLAVIGKMVKELFQLVRELRILDERLGYYSDSMDVDSKSRESAEITLKGIWIDMVEQGAKNPASVYGMARELQFTALPDLFFSVHPKRVKDIDNDVDRLDFNRKVKEVLKRKLRTFLDWKERTYHELGNRRIFTLKYLRQHFDIIKMYMSWVKPYLRNLRRLAMSERQDSPDLISSFEGAVSEVELMFKRLPNNIDFDKPMEYNKKVYSVVLAYVYFRARPMMQFQQEYQKGPLHIGMIDVQLRAYAWTQKEIDNYLQMKEQEDMEFLSTVDNSVKAAMEALGDELEAYLKEAGEEMQPHKGKKKRINKKPSMYDPFLHVFRGTFDLLGIKATKKPKGMSKFHIEKERALAKRDASGTLWQLYKNFKKRNKCLNW